MSQVAFECRSIGFPCEWALRSDSAKEIVDRVREHAKCAHKMPELSADLVSKVEAAIHPT
jgi:predicted small metal-binding protein